MPASTALASPHCCGLVAGSAPPGDGTVAVGSSVKIEVALDLLSRPGHFRETQTCLDGQQSSKLRKLVGQTGQTHAIPKRSLNCANDRDANVCFKSADHSDGAKISTTDVHCLRAI